MDKTFDKNKLIKLIIMFAVLLFCSACVSLPSYKVKSIAHQPSWSYDGENIVFIQKQILFHNLLDFTIFQNPYTVRYRYYLCTLNKNLGGFHRIKKMDKFAGEVSWSKSGNAVFVFQNRIWRLELKSRKEYPLTDYIEVVTNEYILDPWLSYDGRFLAYVLAQWDSNRRCNSTLVVRDLATNKEVLYMKQNVEERYVHRIYYGSFIDNSIAFRKDNSYVIYDLNKEEAKQTIEINKENEHDKLPLGFDFKELSPDKTTYVGSSEATIVVYNKEFKKKYGEYFNSDYTPDKFYFKNMKEFMKHFKIKKINGLKRKVFKSQGPVYFINIYGGFPPVDK